MLIDERAEDDVEESVGIGTKIGAAGLGEGDPARVGAEAAEAGAAALDHLARDVGRMDRAEDAGEVAGHAPDAASDLEEAQLAWITSIGEELEIGAHQAIDLDAAAVVEVTLGLPRLDGVDEPPGVAPRAVVPVGLHPQRIDRPRHHSLPLTVRHVRVDRHGSMRRRTRTASIVGTG